MLNTNRNLQIGYKKIQIKLSKLKLDGDNGKTLTFKS